MIHINRPANNYLFLFDISSPDRIRVVRHDSTSSANMDGLNPSVLTGAAVQRSGVFPTLCSLLSPQLDEPTISIGNISPVRSPGVLDEPVVHAVIVSAIAHQGDSVVNSDIGVIVASIKHTTRVKTPVISSNRGRERSCICTVFILS